MREVVATSEWEGVIGDSTWRVLQGDACSVLANLPDESVDCIVTSPPYYSLRDYEVEGQLGLELEVEEYVGSLTKVFIEARRILKPEGLCFLNIGDTYYSGKGRSHGTDKKSSKRRFGLRPVDRSGGLGDNVSRKSLIGIPSRVSLDLVRSGWTLRSTIIWHRDKALPEAVTDRPRRSYEFVYMFSKSRFYYFDRRPLIEQNVDEDVWTINPRTTNESKLKTAPYPEELVDRILSIGCKPGGVVLDPFVGSGTTMFAAARNGFSSIGIDLHPECCAYSAQRLDSLSKENY